MIHGIGTDIAAVSRLAGLYDRHGERAAEKLLAPGEREAFGKAPEKYDFWDFGTNAVVPVSMGVPTIGFGPGEYKLSHMRDEHCAVSQVQDACRFYAELIARL